MSSGSSGGGGGFQTISALGAAAQGARQHPQCLTPLQQAGEAEVGPAGLPWGKASCGLEKCSPTQPCKIARGVRFIAQPDGLAATRTLYICVLSLSVSN